MFEKHHHPIELTIDIDQSWSPFSSAIKHFRGKKAMSFLHKTLALLMMVGFWAPAAAMADSDSDSESPDSSASGWSIAGPPQQCKPLTIYLHKIVRRVYSGSSCLDVCIDEMGNYESFVAQHQPGISCDLGNNICVCLENFLVMCHGLWVKGPCGSSRTRTLARSTLHRALAMCRSATHQTVRA